MMNEHNIGCLAEWIMLHRRGGAFKDNTLDQIVAGLAVDIEENNLLYVFDDDLCDFNGLVTLIADREHKILFVKNLIITRHSALVVFMRYFNEHFLGYMISANRKDIEVEYNVNRLFHLLNLRHH